MKIYSIYDNEFTEYGKVLDGDYSDFIEVLKNKPRPFNNTIYVPSDAELESLPEAKILCLDSFGGLPIQIGYCNGHNSFLNCLEYHKNSEVNITEGDMVLLFGKVQEIENNTYDTSKVKAFWVPAGKAVEIYSTTLHYAPCGIEGKGFRVIVILPRGTNLARPEGASDPLLWASNKWLLAHADSAEAKQGAHVGLVGENIHI